MRARWRVSLALMFVLLFARDVQGLILSCRGLLEVNGGEVTEPTRAFLSTLEKARRERLVGETELRRLRDAERPISPWDGVRVVGPEKMGYHVVWAKLCAHADLQWPSVRQRAGEWVDEITNERAARTRSETDTQDVFRLQELQKIQLPGNCISGVPEFVNVFYENGRPYALFVHGNDRYLYLVDLRSRKYVRTIGVEAHPSRVFTFQSGSRTYGVTYLKLYRGEHPTLINGFGKPAYIYEFQYVLFDPFSGKTLDTISLGKSTHDYHGFGFTEWRGKHYAVSGWKGKLAFVEASPSGFKLDWLQGVPNTQYDGDLYRDTFGKFVTDAEGGQYFVQPFKILDRGRAGVRVFDLTKKREVQYIHSAGRLSQAFQVFEHRGRPTGIFFEYDGEGGGNDLRVVWLDLLDGTTLDQAAYPRVVDSVIHDPWVLVREGHMHFMSIFTGWALFGEVTPAGRLSVELKRADTRGHPSTPPVDLPLERRNLAVVGLRSSSGLRVWDPLGRYLLPAGGKLDLNEGMHPRVYWDRGKPFIVSVADGSNVQFFSLTGPSSKTPP